MTPYEQETIENILGLEQSSVEIKILNVWPSEIFRFKVMHCKYVDVKSLEKKICKLIAEKL